MRRVLPDTSVLVCVLRNPGSPQGLRIAQEAASTELLFSALVSAELEEGFASGPHPDVARARLSYISDRMSRCDFGFVAARAFGRLSRTLRSGGRPIGAMDELIAAHALSLDATVVTLNVRHFARVPNLVVEDWSSEALKARG